MNVVLFSQLLFFELIQQAAQVNFVLFLTFWRSQKSHVEHFEIEIGISCLVGSFYHKIV